MSFFSNEVLVEPRFSKWVGGGESFTLFASKILGATAIYVGVMMAWHLGFVELCSLLMTRDLNSL